MSRVYSQVLYVQYREIPMEKKSSEKSKGRKEERNKQSRRDVKMGLSPRR